jgi:hypothetical protein
MAERPPELAHGSAPANFLTAALLPSFHAVSGDVRVPAASRCKVVPPTPVTRGSEAGQSTIGCSYRPPVGVGPVTPRSLEAARTVT